jgi:hypothetical protein
LTIRRSSGVTDRSGSRAADTPVDLRVRVAVGRWLVSSSLVVSNEEGAQ